MTPDATAAAAAQCPSMPGASGIHESCISSSAGAARAVKALMLSAVVWTELKSPPTALQTGNLWCQLPGCGTVAGLCRLPTRTSHECGAGRLIIVRNVQYAGLESSLLPQGRHRLQTICTRDVAVLHLSKLISSLQSLWFEVCCFAWCTSKAHAT